MLLYISKKVGSTISLSVGSRKSTLINSPKIILGEEPTGNLDSESSENIYNLLKCINSEYILHIWNKNIKALMLKREHQCFQSIYEQLALAIYLFYKSQYLIYLPKPIL